MQRAEFITEPTRKTPVVCETDVLIVGGGIAGFGAAITAARCGARTMLVEQQGCLGGLVTLGLVSIPLSYVEGVGKELFEKLRSKGALKGRFVNPEITKFVMERMVLDAGVELLYGSYVIDAIVEKENLSGVIIQNKSGRQAILSHVAVDASGDADVAYYAGVPYEKGSPNHQGYNESTSVQFRVANVDWKRYKSKQYGVWEKELRTAVEKGDLPYLFDKYMNWMIKVPGRPDEHAELIICLAHSRKANCTDAKDLTRMLLEGREQVQYLISFLRKYIAGFENCWLVDTGPMLGVRESRRIIGEYVFTGEDIVLSHKFEDAVLRDTHGMDIHHPTELGHIKHMKLRKPDGQIEEVRIRPGGYYEIPYRCLVPLKIDGLLVAGRCISTTFEGQSGTRLIMTCLNMGQAAGTAAALCVKDNVKPRSLDPQILRKKLIEQGINLKEKPPLHVWGHPREKIGKRFKVGRSDALTDLPEENIRGALTTDIEKEEGIDGAVATDIE